MGEGVADVPIKNTGMERDDRAGFSSVGLTRKGMMTGSGTVGIPVRFQLKPVNISGKLFLRLRISTIHIMNYEVYDLYQCLQR